MKNIKRITLVTLVCGTLLGAVGCGDFTVEDDGSASDTGGVGVGVRVGGGMGVGLDGSPMIMMPGTSSGGIGMGVGF